jgi:hypothetical protein
MNTYFEMAEEKSIRCQNGISCCGTRWISDDIKRHEELAQQVDDLLKPSQYDTNEPYCMVHILTLII